MAKVATKKRVVKKAAVKKPVEVKPLTYQQAIAEVMDIHEKDVKIFNEDDSCDEDGREIYIHINGCRPHYLASLSLDQMHGCCGVLTVHGANIDSSVTDEQRARIAYILNEIIHRYAHEHGYTCLLSSDIEGGDIEAIAKAGKWASMEVFKNKRTGNTVTVYRKFVTGDMLPVQWDD